MTEFKRIATGRAPFCTVGLLKLCDTLDHLAEILGAPDA
jgi:hypothetical protein